MSNKDAQVPALLAVAEGAIQPAAQMAAERPAVSRSVDPPALGPGGLLRFVWTQLTSMRTALVLLFALAVAAVPGSLVPQRSVSPVQVSDFIAANPVVGPVFDRLGMFEVYTSPWFSAIYLLLFVSLVGCIIPRVRVYARALRAQPPRTPRHLARLPAYTSVEVDSAEGLLTRATDELRRRHYRVVTDGASVSAERGYLREAGNLVFHLSLLFLLLGVAVGTLFGYRGTAVVVEGQAFSNNLTQYDDLAAGAWFTPEDLAPFMVTVTDFEAKFETGPVQRGAARLFRAEVEVAASPGAAPSKQVIEVNRPLDVDGTSVHLIGHGYAPRVTIRDGSGQVAFSGPVTFLPQDGSFTSVGVVKVPDGRPERLAFEGIFTPTARSGQGPTSVFPDAALPMLYLNAWSGPPKIETGKPENVYSLDPEGLTQLKDQDGTVVAMRLAPGELFELPDGKGTVEFDGWARWVKLQIGDTPAVPLILGSVGAAVLGLCLSLYVRPRRVWVRVVQQEEGRALLEVGGLDRADARGGLTEDVDELAAHLSDSGPATRSG